MELLRLRTYVTHIIVYLFFASTVRSRNSVRKTERSRDPAVNKAEKGTRESFILAPILLLICILEHSPWFLSFHYEKLKFN